MEVDTSDTSTMEEIIATHIDEAEQAERIFCFSTSPGSPLEEGQISPHNSSLLPPTTSCDEEVQTLPFSEPSFNSSTQNNAWINSGMDTPTASAIDPHSQESQKLNKDKAKAVGCGSDGWRSPTAVVVVNHDTAPMNPIENGTGRRRSDNWDSGWNSTTPHVTISQPTTSTSSSAAPATTTNETINAASVNPLQETPQPSESTTEKPANNGWGSWGANNDWGSWGANNGWRSPIAVGRAASEWSALPMPTGGNESWGSPAPRSPTTGENAVTTVTPASASMLGGSRGNFEDKSEGSFGRGRGRGRGGGRGAGRGTGRGWGGLGGSGRRDDSSPSNQPLGKSFNHSSTSFGNPDSGWGTRSRENNQASEACPTRRHRQEVRLDGPTCLVLRADCNGNSLLNQPGARACLPLQYIEINPQWGPRYINLRCSQPLPFNHSHLPPCGRRCGHCRLT
jgi:hypothetical protein